MELLTQSHSYSQCNYKILCSVLFFSLFFGQNIWNALTTEQYTKCVIDDFTMAHTNIELVIDLWPLRSKGIQQITQHKKIYTRTYMKNRKRNSKFLCHNAYIFFYSFNFIFYWLRDMANGTANFMIYYRYADYYI